MGLDFHSRADKRGRSTQKKFKDSVCSQRNQLESFVQRRLKPFEKSSLLLVSFSCNFSEKIDYKRIGRREVCNLIKANNRSVVDVSGESRDVFWAKLSNHTFALAPQGRGIDTHRVWEILQIRSIPIVIASPMDRLYESYPIIIVSNWSLAFNKTYLAERKNLLRHRFGADHFSSAVVRRLSLAYWIKQVNLNQSLPFSQSDADPPAVESFPPGTLTIPVIPGACKWSSLRLGDPHDGGWTLCNTFAVQPPRQQQQQQQPHHSCIVYSFGIRDDYSFDDACEAKGCCVHGFDPSVELSSVYNSVNKTFHHLGLGETGKYPPGTVSFRWPGIGYMAETNSKEWELSSVRDIRARLGHTNALVKVMKIDVEGAEWYIQCLLTPPA